jgi:hypothetical protein
VGRHSAGAILVAENAVDRAWMKDAKIPKYAFRGIAAVSAPYDLRARGRHGESDVYAPTAELQEEASPILHVIDPVPAAVIAVGSTEAYVASSQALADIIPPRVHTYNFSHSRERIIAAAFASSARTIACSSRP